jgi:hypothetical protein
MPPYGLLHTASIPNMHIGAHRARAGIESHARKGCVLVAFSFVVSKPLSLGRPNQCGTVLWVRPCLCFIEIYDYIHIHSVHCSSLIVVVEQLF